MKVSDYITFLVNGECANLGCKDVGDMSINPDVAPTDVQLENQRKFISYINQANLAVHKKFNLRQKEFELDNPLDGEEYTLPSDFMSPIRAYYASDKTEVKLKDSITTNMVDEVDTKVSILFPAPYTAKIKGTDSQSRPLIILVYSASPTLVTKAATDLKIPDVYTDAILNYAAYKAFSSVSGQMSAENNTYYVRFNASCREIIMQGLHNENALPDNTRLSDNGFI